MQKSSFPPLLGDSIFLLGYAISYLLVMALLRACLLYANINLAGQVDNLVLFNSFLVGLRFDLIIACILAAPLVLTLLLPGGLGNRKYAIIWLSLTGSLTIFAGVVEIEFYREFHVRLNSIAFHYLQEDAETVSSMIWNGYPVVRYLALWFVLSAIYRYLLTWVNRNTEKSIVTSNPVATRAIVFLLVAFLTLWGGRGTLRSGPPLRWGDAYHSQYLFANHLALNGSYTLGKAATAASHQTKDASWLDAMAAEEALKITRDMLLTPSDSLIAPEDFPMLRLHTPRIELPVAPKNVVFIMMESFSGAFTGALSGVTGITPAFDKLAEQGLLFDHFFSNGTHTHQGMFASVACFPNLPGHEYLMQQPEGQHHFSGLPALLGPRGFNDVYVYNGHFAWDNQEGFFRNQGMSNFIGRDEYVDPVFIDPTWGVSDEDMFNRAIVELDKLQSDTPFYAVLQTLSNHVPYAVPEKLAFEPITGHGRLDEHLTGQRYSDWALGQFFEQAKEKPWYDETVFVVVGDHGFGVDLQLTDIDLLRFHVPFLILGPSIRETYGSRNHTVATQLDIIPTLVGLLGEPFAHQCWGRNLLSLTEGDRGFGMFKPSGSDQTVALIQGNQITVIPPTGGAITGSYSLYPDLGYEPREPDEPGEKSAEKLGAFIQSALNALISNRTGLQPDSDIEK